MSTKFCQCCAMPMDDPALYGTDADGTPNPDYCKYCYDKGIFPFEGTMEDMIEVCVPHMTENNPEMTADQARTMMREFFPTLKRWKKA